MCLQTKNNFKMCQKAAKKMKKKIKEWKDRTIQFYICLRKIATILPWSSGPTVVINAVKHFPIHWWTSIWVGAMCSSNFKTMDKVGST